MIIGASELWQDYRRRACVVENAANQTVGTCRAALSFFELPTVSPAQVKTTEPRQMLNSETEKHRAEASFSGDFAQLFRSYYRPTARKALTASTDSATRKPVSHQVESAA